MDQGIGGVLELLGHDRAGDLGQQLLRPHGGRWFDEHWQPAFEEPRMREAWEFYKKILSDAGEPNPATNGYTECLAIMQSGKAALWYDATVTAGALEAPGSKVAGRIGYAQAPSARKGNNGWLWAPDEKPVRRVHYRHHRRKR